MHHIPQLLGTRTRTYGVISPEIHLDPISAILDPQVLYELTYELLTSRLPYRVEKRGRLLID